MKIAGVEAIPLDAQLKVPFRFGRVVRTHSSNVILRITTSDGLVGWGEACPVPQLTGETRESIVAVVNERVAPALVGREPTHWRPLMHELRKGLYGCQATLAAVETGLLDLTGKALGVSMCELLGGRFRDAVEVHGSVGWEESPGAMAESARRQAGQYRVLKLYAGRGQLHGDLERIEAARDAVGAGHPFIVDVNGLWRQREVLEVCGALAHAQVEVLEQPVSPTDVAGMAAVTRVLGEAHGIDVAADESVTQASDVLVAATHRTASLINVGFMKLGGPAAAHGIATLAGAANLGVMVGSVVELGIASAAGLHLAASLPELGAPSYLVGSGKYVRQITSPIPVDHDGFMCVPTGPGLGIEVDEEAITALDLRKAR